MSAAQFVEFQSAAQNPNIPTVTDITVEDLHAKKDKVAIFDVRRPDEWVGEFGHIAEAEHLVLDTLPMRLSELPRDRTIVFVCRSGGRSAQASAFAKENGFTSVFNMRGGMIEWTQKNLPVIEKNN